MPEFKCESISCSRSVNVSSLFVDENGKPKFRVFCHRCYIPDNPTTGWLISKASGLPEFSHRKLSTLSNDKQIREYCKKILGFKESKNRKSEDRFASFNR